MNTPEITIGSRWREKRTGKLATVFHLSNTNVLYSGDWSDGWSVERKDRFPDRFEPHVWTLDEAMREAGHILGTGQKWHRDDFTEEDLPPGYRPALLKEPQEDGDEFKNSDGEWEVVKYTTRQGAGPSFLPRRTRRPLPAVEEWIPLGPEDVPPGSVFRNEIDGWDAPASVNSMGVVLANRLGNRFDWRQLFNGWQILRPGTTEWQPCKKLKS